MTTTIDKTAEQGIAPPPFGYPTFCPTWCASQHEQVWEHEEGQTTQDQLWTHLAFAGSASLPAIIDANGIIDRPRGGHWDLDLHQDYHSDRRAAYSTQMLSLRVTAKYAETNGEVIALTSGDARVLAARLIAGADHLDRQSCSDSAQ